MESKSRSFVKAISWRITATIITAIIAFLLTGEMKFAATVALFDTVVKFILYFVHERIWNNVTYGRAVHHPHVYDPHLHSAPPTEAATPKAAAGQD